MNSDLVKDATAFRGYHFGDGVGPHHLSDVHCSGIEGKLLECSYSQPVVGNRQCLQPKHDAGVICDGKSPHQSLVPQANS